MPCYVTTEMRITSQIKNLERLKKALQDMGMNFNYNENYITVPTSYGDILIDSSGSITYTIGLETTVNQIKEAYSRATVKAWAKKKGFMVRKGKHPATQRETLIVRTGM